MYLEKSIIIVFGAWSIDLYVFIILINRYDIWAMLQYQV